MAFTNLDPKSFKAGFEADPSAVIIDVRTPAELAEGSIDGHIMINVMDPAFPGKIAALDKSKPYYIYCRSGNRSGQVCNYMSGLGFEQLYNLQGGIMLWNSTF
jgi:rhodanese-related sulfurtransferase